MPLSPLQKQGVEDIIRNNLRDKLRNHNPETSEMPFHFRLLGQDRMALYSFIHSINRKFGASVFEPVAEALASLQFKTVQKQHKVGDVISREAQSVINDIVTGLTTGGAPDKAQEVERIRQVCRTGEMQEIKPVKADLFIQSRAGTVHLFDLKTAKPNMANFKDFKRTLLEWVAIWPAQNPKADVHSCIAIPYNPYEPEPYNRWTLKNMLDLPEELKVAEEFWNFLCGFDVYSELLDCFEKVGCELKPEIDARFSQFK